MELPGSVASSCEYGDETSHSIKDEEFHDQLINNQPLNRTQYCKVNCFDFVLRELEPAWCRLPVYCMTSRVPDASFVVCFDDSFIMTTCFSTG